MSKPHIVTGPQPKGGGLLHASCVALNGRAVLILGASGQGKSALALELMGFGATLVADDQVKLSKKQTQVYGASPPTIKGRIEARFVGILEAEVCDIAPIILVVDLDVEEKDRLPANRRIILLGESLPLLHNSTQRHFPAAILQTLKGARSE